jgi:pimeloyl-ACP methyl ester carboxylesterase
MPFTETNGLKTYYEIHGKSKNGDTVVLLHHGFGCTKMWKDIYPALVENGYRVVMYDRRGYGQSERGTDFKKFYESDGFRPESVKELAVLRESLDLDSFHIIGQCEGGVIGADYSAKYPEQVLSFVTSSTQCYSNIPMPELNRQKFPKPFRDLAPDLRKKLINWHGKDYAESSYNMFRTYGGAYGKGFFDLRGVLQLVKCPTLVLYPDRSFIFDVEQAIAFYRCLPMGELAVLPNCSHNTYEDQPGEYIRFVLSFFTRHQP